MASVTSAVPPLARNVRSRHLRTGIACEPLDRRVLMAAGDLDTTFNNVGFASLSLPGASFHINDVALQLDGKLILAGSKAGNVALARLHSNGTLDTSFGNDGLFEWTRRSQATDVLVQPDGKILVAFGAAAQGFTNMAVGRILANGVAHDSAFGTDGIAHTSQWGPDVVHDIALQSDGKIIAVGSRTAGDADFAIVRYNANGSPDSSFDNDGIVIAGFGQDEHARAVAIDYNGNPSTNSRWGQLVVAGDKRGGSGLLERITICRLNTDGTFDDSFDGDGKLTSPDLSASPEEYPTDVLIQPGGSIVVSGTALVPGTAQGDFVLARYVPGGALDGSFGTSGSGIVESDFGGQEVSADMAPSYAGGFLVSGSRNGTAAVAAYTSDGLLDSRFSGSGFRTAPVAGQAALATTGNSIAPVRRLVLARGNTVARCIDVGSVMSIRSFEPEAAEAGQDPATFFVQRTQPLGTTERVYISVGGTARPPYLLNADYTVSGMTMVHPFQGRSYIDIPPGETVAAATITPVNDVLAEGDETIILSVSSDDAYDISSASPAVTLIIRDDDLVGGPNVAEAEFVYETPPQRVTFAFNQNVATSIGADDFAVTGPTGAVPFSFAYDATANTATLSFSGVLADGNYSARAISAGITNTSGQAMAADHVLDFFFLNGDANHDAVVNLLDFNRLAANFGHSNRTFSQADFNYDGTVNLQDFNILASRFGTSLDDDSDEDRLAQRA